MDWNTIRWNERCRFPCSHMAMTIRAVTRRTLGRKPATRGGGLNDQQVMHAISIDDAYQVERVLAQGSGGVIELVTIGGAGPFVRKKIPSELARRRVWSTLTECSSGRLPHVEATYELPDQFVVVYDFVPGENLESHMGAQGRIAPAEAIQLIENVCEAAEDLHRHGIIHRDISPANVVVSSDGAHLLDLGIARMRIEGANKDTTSLGTWGFASPEQYGFAQTDARSDVYSIGRLLGYLLTGVRPDADGYDAALADESTVPSQARCVIERACAFEPSARYQSAGELAKALHDLDSGQEEKELLGTGADAPAAELRKHGARGSRPNRGALVAAVAVIALLALAITFALLSLGARTRTPADDQPSAQGTDSSSGTAPGAEPATKPEAGKATVGKDVLELTETGWSADSSGYVHYGFGLKNSSEDVCIQFPTVEITGKAADGSLLFSDTQVFSFSFAGQTSYYGGQAGDGTVPATVEFRLLDPEDYSIISSSERMEFETSDVSFVSDGFGGTSLVGRVTALSDDIPQLYTDIASVSFVLRDKAGNIVYGDSTSIDRPKKGKSATFDIPLFDAPAYDSYEVSVHP